MNNYVLSDLKLAKVDNRTFDDIVPDIMRIVYKYTKIYLDKWSNIMYANNYSFEDVAQDMFVNIFNRKNKNSLSNIEKHFVYASENNLSMKYIQSVIGKAVYFNVLCIARTFNRKRKPLSLEDINSFYGNDDNSSDDCYKFLEDKRENIEIKSSYNLFIESIDNIEFDYYIIDKDKKRHLCAYDIIDMIIDKKSVSDMTGYVYMINDKRISYVKMNEVVKAVRALLIKSYEEGNCPIDLS